MVATILITSTLVRPFYLYDIDQGNIQLVNEVVRNDISTSGIFYLGADKNAEIIAIYRGGDKKASIFKRRGNLIDDVIF